MFFNNTVAMAILIQIFSIFCLTCRADEGLSGRVSGSMKPPRRNWGVHEVQKPFAAILINVLHEKIYNYFKIIEPIRCEQEKRYQEESNMDTKVSVWNDYEGQIKLHFDYTCCDIDNNLIPELMETNDSQAISFFMKLYYNFKSKRLHYIDDFYDTV